MHQQHIVWATTFRYGFPQSLSCQFDLIMAGATQTETSLLKQYVAGECVDLHDVTLISHHHLQCLPHTTIPRVHANLHRELNQGLIRRGFLTSHKQINWIRLNNAWCQCNAYFFMRPCSQVCNSAFGMKGTSPTVCSDSTTNLLDQGEHHTA